MRAAWLALFAALAPFQQSLALLDLLIAQRQYSGFSTCSLFTPPAPSAHPYLATCGLSLVNTNSSEVLVQALGCAEGEGARPNSTGLIADHGRDFFILELSRGGRVRTRLGGRHVGQGRYLFPEWNHVSPGAWNATFLLWATARRDLLQGALAHAPEDAVVEAGKQVQQRSPAAELAEPRQQPHRLPPGFNALLHTNYLWQLQHWYVETTPRRPPVLTAQLHKGGQEDGRSPLTVAAGNPQPRTSLSMLSSEAGAAGKSSASASALLKQHRQHQHQQHQRLTSSRRRHAHRRRLQESAGAGAGGGDGTPTSDGMAAAATNPSMSTDMHNSSRSSSAGCSSSKRTAISRPLCTAGAAKGEWVRLPEGALDCPPGVCRGPLSPLLYGSPDNVAMDFHDVYVPYSCRYRLYTPDEAAACLSATRLVVLGDSRAHELQWYLSMHYPGVHAHHHLLLPYRVGIRALLAAEAAALDSQLEAAALGGGAGGGDGGGPSAGTAQQQAVAGTTTAPAPLPTLRELMSGYDVLVLSSELHDIADYERAAADYLQPYGLDPGPPGLRVSVAVATNSTTNTTHNANHPDSLATHPSSKGRDAEALHPGGAPVWAQCAPDTPERAQLPKWRPVAQYLDALSELVTRYQELRAELQQAGLLRVRRVLWLLPGYRPAATPTCLPNQLERMLCIQEWEVAQVAGRAGWEVLDMGTMAQDGPAAWWSDDVHVSGARSGRKRTHSGLQVMQLQALFNVLCNPQQE